MLTIDYRAPLHLPGRVPPVPRGRGACSKVAGSRGPDTGGGQCQGHAQHDNVGGSHRSSAVIVRTNPVRGNASSQRSCRSVWQGASSAVESGATRPTSSAVQTGRGERPAGERVSGDDRVALACRSAATPSLPPPWSSPPTRSLRRGMTPDRVSNRRAVVSRTLVRPLRDARVPVTRRSAGAGPADCTAVHPARWRRPAPCACAGDRRTTPPACRAWWCAGRYPRSAPWRSS